MTLDEQRVATGRDGLIPCVVHQDHKQSQSTDHKLGAKLIKYYGKLLSSKVFKVITVIITLGMLMCGAWGWTGMIQRFDPFLLLPSDSYLREWIRYQKQYYPDDGWTADVYSGELSYQDLGAIDELVTELEQLKNNGRILRGLSYWTHFCVNNGLFQILMFGEQS